MLAGDGVLPDLWRVLWEGCRARRGGQVEGFTMSFVIPDTVEFSFRSPAAWFFTTAEGKFRKKNKRNCTLGRLESDFLPKGCAGRAKTDRSADVPPILASFASCPDESTHGSPTVRYMDESGVLEWLRDPGRSPKGILQRFVAAKGGVSTTMRVIWSPGVFLAQVASAEVSYETNSIAVNVEDRGKRIAKHLASSMKLGISRADALHEFGVEEKLRKRRRRRRGLKDEEGASRPKQMDALSIHRMAATFDGDADTGQHGRVRSSVLQRRLRSAAEEIVELIHLGTNKSVKVTRMVVDFRQGRDGQLWLLGIRSLRHRGGHDELFGDVDEGGEAKEPESSMIRSATMRSHSPESTTRSLPPVDAGAHIPLEIPLRTATVSAGERGALWRQSKMRMGEARARALESSTVRRSAGPVRGLLPTSMRAVDELVDVHIASDRNQNATGSKGTPAVSAISAMRQKSITSQVCCPSCGIQTRATLLRAVDAGAVIDHYDAMLEVANRTPVCPPALLHLSKVLGLELGRKLDEEKKKDGNKNSDDDSDDEDTDGKSTSSLVDEEMEKALSFLPERLRPQSASSRSRNLSLRSKKSKRWLDKQNSSTNKLSFGFDLHPDAEDDDKDEELLKRAAEHYPLEPIAIVRGATSRGRRRSIPFLGDSMQKLNEDGPGAGAEGGGETIWNHESKVDAARASRGAGLHFAFHGGNTSGLAPAQGSSAYYVQKWMSENLRTAADDEAVQVISTSLSEQSATVSRQAFALNAARTQSAADTSISQSPIRRAAMAAKPDEETGIVAKPESFPKIISPITRGFLSSSLLLSAFGEHSVPFAWVLDAIARQRGRAEVHAGRAMVDHARGRALLTEDILRPAIHKGILRVLQDQEIASIITRIARAPRSLSTMQAQTCGPTPIGHHVVRPVPPTLAHAWPGLSAEAYCLSGASDLIARLLSLNTSTTSTPPSAQQTDHLLAPEVTPTFTSELSKWHHAGASLKKLWAAEVEHTASVDEPLKETDPQVDRLDRVTESAQMLYGETHALPRYAIARQILGTRWKHVVRSSTPKFLAVPLSGDLLRSLPVPVCEECYMVFADLGTLRLEGINTRYAVKHGMTSGVIGSQNREIDDDAASFYQTDSDSDLDTPKKHPSPPRPSSSRRPASARLAREKPKPSHPSPSQRRNSQQSSTPSHPRQAWATQSSKPPISTRSKPTQKSPQLLESTQRRLETKRRPASATLRSHRLPQADDIQAPVFDPRIHFPRTIRVRPQSAALPSVIGRQKTSSKHQPPQIKPSTSPRLLESKKHVAFPPPPEEQATPPKSPIRPQSAQVRPTSTIIAISEMTRSYTAKDFNLEIGPKAEERAKLVRDRQLAREEEEIQLRRQEIARESRRRKQLRDRLGPTYVAPISKSSYNRLTESSTKRLQERALRKLQRTRKLLGQETP